MLIALAASASVAMVMNANPRDRPVNLSIMTAASVTVPACEKYSVRLSLVAANGMLPTYSLLPIYPFRSGCGLQSSFPTFGFRTVLE